MTTTMKTASNYCTFIVTEYAKYQLFKLHPSHCSKKVNINTETSLVIRLWCRWKRKKILILICMNENWPFWSLATRLDRWSCGLGFVLSSLSLKEANLVYCYFLFYIISFEFFHVHASNVSGLTFHLAKKFIRQSYQSIEPPEPTSWWWLVRTKLSLEKICRGSGFAPKWHCFR